MTKEYARCKRSILATGSARPKPQNQAPTNNNNNNNNNNNKKSKNLNSSNYADYEQSDPYYDPPPTTTSYSDFPPPNTTTSSSSDTAMATTTPTPSIGIDPFLLDDEYYSNTVYDPNKKFTDDPKIKAKCVKAISTLRRLIFSDTNRHGFNKSTWRMFSEPVKLTFQKMQAYNAKIKNKIDLGTIVTKLFAHTYIYVSEFVLEVRRVFSNCIRFNTDWLTKDLRKRTMILFKEVSQFPIFLILFIKPILTHPTQCEDVLLDHLSRLYVKPVVHNYEMCMDVMAHMMAVPDTDDNSVQLCLYFLHPVTLFFDGKYPEGYLKVVKKPMDYGTLVENLLTAEYATFSQFEADIMLISTNCKAYYHDKQVSERSDRALTKTIIRAT